MIALRWIMDPDRTMGGAEGRPGIDTDTDKDKDIKIKD
jgi:hypothetical protein